MCKRDLIWSLLLACGFSAVATAAVPDKVLSADGTAIGTGQISSITPTKVVLQMSAGEKEFATNEFAQIAFEGEPGTLRTVRKYVLEGNYENALDVLEKVQVTDVMRKEISVDVDFYKAYASGKMALAGNGDLKETGQLLFAFCNANQTSYHYFQAVELLGDLLVADRLFDKAAQYYALLAEAPWPDYKMRAGVAMGRACLAQKKIPEALKAFDGVLAITAEGDDAERLRTAASLGKLRCQAETGKPEEVIKQVEEIIAKTDPEKSDILAQAYLILGSAYRKAGKNKEALFAYLHVDVLYPGHADSHAEALANMIDLFSGMQKNDLANRAKQTLMERYPTSPWAQPQQ